MTAKPNGEFKIEKGVPMPLGLGQRGAAQKYPWRETEIGNSFFVPGRTASDFRNITHASRKTGFKFATRAVEGGVRVWRVA